jgi:tetratricopeptide (TPR) repeat protein
MIGRALPGVELVRSLVDTIQQRTGGNPLFVLALIDHWRATSAVIQESNGWRAATEFAELGSGVPESLTAMIHQNMETLSDQEQLVLEAASVAGREFVPGVLAAGLGWTEEDAEQLCANLAREGTFLRDAGVFERPVGGFSARFGFIHALYREAVYQRVPAGRRSRLHRAIGQELEKAYGDQADANATELARHFRYGGDYPRAIRYFRLGAEQALRRSAPREAARLLQSALELVEQQPETLQSLADEFSLRGMLAPAMLVVKGFADPDAVLNFQRARELGLHLGRVEEMYQLLFHLAAMHEFRGEYQIAEQVLDERLRLPRPKIGQAVQIASDTLLACSLFHKGDFSGAVERAENGVNLYDPRQHAALIASYGENPAVACHGWAALSLWCLGYADLALERVQRSLDLAGHPDLQFSLAGAKVRAAHLYQLCRDPAQTLKWATEAATLADAHGYLYASAFARALQGWGLFLGSRTAEGLTLVQDGIAALNQIGARMDRPYLLALLSEMMAAGGRVSEAVAMITEALGQVQDSRTYFYEAELHRVRGVILLQQGGPAGKDAAEASFRQAIEVAKQQKARTLELRASVNLCRLLRSRGLLEAAIQALTPIYQWFEERDATVDLIEAGELVTAAGQTPHVRARSNLP